MNSLPPPRNLLLASLSPEDWSAVAPRLERVTLRPRQILEEPRTEIRAVYFIERGFAAVQVRTQADGTHGVGLVGRFGMTGLSLLLGTRRAPFRISVQVAGEAFRLDAAEAAALFAENTALRRLGLAYIQAVMVQGAQLSLCNARHSMKHRVRRWLLLAQDWLGEPEIAVSHQLIAGLLGVRRASVSEQIERLEQAGIVRQQRASITVLCREALEQDSCECHALISAEYRRLFTRR
ncbi:Crp/Fnr family transcriptional regulator [Methylobacterium nodulans]|uniref:Crp/Fnr family transcriptional regulator n=1 Tax=Methylobacterium nodulans TaxID=114616 RepID=UPI001FCBF6C1|nr:Crp/Fnr family transcriptional regulator [Methylobacterium nodulans]